MLQNEIIPIQPFNIQHSYFGYVVESAAHIVDEYVFENLDDFQKALAPLIAPASQKWTIFRII